MPSIWDDMGVSIKTKNNKEIHRKKARERAHEPFLCILQNRVTAKKKEGDIDLSFK